MKRTIIVGSGAAAAVLRLELARSGSHGTEVRSIEQVAARLVGGFCQPVARDLLAETAGAVIAALSAEELGDLCGIADLPGLPGALISCLRKVWLADIDLAERARREPGVARLSTLVRLEAEVLARLPSNMLSPAALARRARERVAHAASVLELFPIMLHRNRRRRDNSGTPEG
jgi:hypothetical protein